MIRYSKLRPLKMEDPLDRLNVPVAARGWNKGVHNNWSVLLPYHKSTEDVYPVDWVSEQHSPVFIADEDSKEESKEELNKDLGIDTR